MREWVEKSINNLMYITELETVSEFLTKITNNKRRKHLFWCTRFKCNTTKTRNLYCSIIRYNMYMDSILRWLAMHHTLTSFSVCFNFHSTLFVWNMSYVRFQLSPFCGRMQTYVLQAKDIVQTESLMENFIQRKSL